MTYEQAAAQLVMMVDRALKAGLNGAQAPPKVSVQSETCVNNELVSTDEIQPVYQYEFPIDLLGPNPESFVSAAASALEMDGLSIKEQDTEGVVRRFATDENFGLEVFVNYKTGMALIGGTGPCVKAPK